MTVSCDGKWHTAKALLKRNFQVLSPNLVTSFPNGTVQFSKLQFQSSSAETYQRFMFGVFSFRLRLPYGFSAGIISAVFLTSVSQKSSRKAVKTRDEIDLEFLGHTESKKIIFATNYYAQGKGQDIHEEGFSLWFDPAAKFHTYTIRWTKTHIQWYVDGIPLRETARARPNTLYVNKPMYIQISQWDASAWATDGGRIKSDYSRGPFNFQISAMELSNTCRWQKGKTPKCLSKWSRPGGLSKRDRIKMYIYRRRYLLWSNVK